MFEVLPASAAVAGPASPWGARAVSLALHAALIAAAVGLGAAPPRDPGARVRQVSVVFRVPGVADPRPARPSPGPALAVPAVPRPSVLEIPPGVAPPEPFPPGAPVWEPGPGPAPGIIVADPGVAPAPTPLDARAADEPPVLLAHPSPRYPELLRQAGLEARVVVEAVLDTAGRAEPASVRIVQGAHALFESEARRVVLDSRYRAARAAGRAVRVRIQVPVSFAIRR